MNLRTFSVLQLALGASIAVHAVLLTVRFVDPQAFNRVFEDTPLEVILVNARTNERPDKARAVAQASMAGGGDADAGRATSPLPPSLRTAIGDEAEQDSQRKLQSLQEQQNLMLSTVKNKLASMPLVDPKEVNTTPDEQDREEKRRQLIKLLAEIERRINEENARPKKRYISPSTREVPYAVYYDHMRRAIEDKGTEHFPEVGGKKLYGELVMSVEVNVNGQVIRTSIDKSSGNRILDRRAEAIVRSAAPFGRFSEAMRQSAEIIVVPSRFKFTREETLETKFNTK